MERPKRKVLEPPKQKPYKPTQYSQEQLEQLGNVFQDIKQKRAEDKTDGKK